MKNLLGYILGLTFLSLTMLTPAMAQGDAASQNGPTTAAPSPTLKLLPNCLTTDVQNAGIDCVSETVLHFTNLLLWLIAVSAFFYLLYGAFLYTSAFGDETKIKTAKSVMKYALIGVVIATLANFAVDLLKEALQVELK